MTPYYDEDGITIYHADCRDVLPGFMGGVDLVMTSPPYNLHGDGSTPNGTYFQMRGGYGQFEDAMPHEDYVAWQREVVGLCWDILADDGAIFYNHKPRVKGNQVKLPFELVEPYPIRQVITWDRGSGFNRQLTYFVPTYEWLLLVAKPAFRLVTRSVNDLWRIPFIGGEPHPAPFPIGLPLRAIGATAAEIVLDPFAGIGTTLRAAKQLGRRAIGIEIEERYCEIAVQRLAQGVLEFG